jgi:pimeloyl-ACP methyl ester carboxylesterase
VLFEASGHSLLLINDLPHEGDHYDFGWNLIPLKLKKGNNVFVLKVGRFPRIRARLIEPKSDIQFTPRDVTMPDILEEENKEYLGAIRVINTSNKWLKNYTINADLDGTVITSRVPNIAPMTVRKVPFTMSSNEQQENSEDVELTLRLISNSNKLLSTQKIELKIRSKNKHHKKTFLSAIDASVQYYSVAPSTDTSSKAQALFLSVHGASVEAVNQANAYKQKDWGNLVAPTNRRPFGFAWEDWGRMDALEVLEDARNIFQPDPTKIYLTGHSMGGHGTWYLGATYPDHFAAIAPCAGYPDLLFYRDSFIKRRLQMPQVQLDKFGMTAKVIERMKMEVVPTPVENMMSRAGTPSRTLKLIRNYLHYGVYILHGEKDNVVPTFIARDMRERLGTFHNDFTYYEYPGGEHWYGDHSVDWKPIFEFFKQRTIKDPNDIEKFEFYTGSPGVSSRSNFITIHQQEKAFEISSFNFSKEDVFQIETENIAQIEVDFSVLNDTINSIIIDKTEINILNREKVYFKKTDSEWQISSAPSKQEKGPHRNGGFKDAFNNNVVLVYASKGSETENIWYFNRARFDAETFWYRANGNIEIVKDVNFSLKKYADRNVIIYGNEDNNAAWKLLLKNSPIRVKNNEVYFNGKKLTGSQWGMYFIVPRKDSDFASVGVITATGYEGMKAAYMNHYLVNGSTFPDVVLFDDIVLLNGASSVKCAGFFGNDWTVENGEFEWK